MKRCFILAGLLWLGFASPKCAHSEEPTLQQLLTQEKYDERDRGLCTRREAVTAFVSSHAKPELKYRTKGEDGRETEYSDRRILVITWFEADCRTALCYSVNEQGKAFNVRHCYNWAHQNSNYKTLANDQLKSLQGLLSELPKSTAKPPINRTVYVSFKARDEWLTETYDSKALPEEFEAVLKIVGERDETSSRKERKRE